ncbi:MAG: hypothetical protein QXG98_01945 [Candidatus Micrarchaeia archaeon]
MRPAMVDKKTLAFFLKVIVATLLIDAGLLFLFPLQLVIYIAVAILTLSALAFLYLINRKLFLLALVLLFFALLYFVWQIDVSSLLARATERVRAMTK